MQIVKLFGGNMENLPKYLVVEREALPEVFARVLFAKNLIEKGEASSLSEAARKAGISRSAYYKYRDTVFAYNREMSSSVATYHFILKDKAGVLSTIISEISRLGANILTINQSIPIDGFAPVSITVSLDTTNHSDMDLLGSIKTMEDVVEARKLVTR